MMEGMGSPEASQISVTLSSSSMAVWFSTYVILGFAEKTKYFYEFILVTFFSWLSGFT